ncbi:hypothetical protein OAO01_03385 [Oligoflexia bacterium]|nr:hypothetical protein [Oligoflexia bacterium]
MLKFKLLIFALFLTSCVPTQSISLDRHSEALRLIDQGTAQLRGRKLDQAEASFTVAAETAPLPAAYDGLGCVALVRGDYVRAEKLLWRAYNMGDPYDHALGNLALLYEAQGLKEKAAALYLDAMKKNPKNFRLRNNFAVFLVDNYSESERYIMAVDELLKAQALAKHPLIEENLKKLN